MDIKPLNIGDLQARIPVIQGGMGVGISLGGLAGAVAKEGAIGTISSAQIGFRNPDFEKHPAQCNEQAIVEEVAKAKEISGGGIVAVNIMTALRHQKEHVAASIKAGADLIISGAGIPLNLPELTAGSSIKIAPIVSSARCAALILKKWIKSYNRVADLIVIEGPKAGGHLGFSAEDAVADLDYDQEIRAILQETAKVEAERGVKIPVVVAGGVFDRQDMEHMLSLGADGVQIASRFVATPECDAAQGYKEAYIRAKEEDVTIIKSPVGMPGRAIRNEFLEKLESGKEPIKKCLQCLAKCEPASIPYCITDRLIRAAKGDVKEGLLFCGANVGRINEIVPVKQLLAEFR